MRPGAIFSVNLTAGPNEFSVIIVGLAVELSAINKLEYPPGVQRETAWIFAYGSLVWRPGFEYEQRELAELNGWRREFSQGSPDHRGTPELPGRVLTLRRDEAGRCSGVAYRVALTQWQAVVEYLDVRESGGYSQQHVRVCLANKRLVSALTYIALPDNPHACEPETLERLVGVIESRVGPSGSNRDYVLNLAQALVSHGIKDDAVELVANRLRLRSQNRAG